MPGGPTGAETRQNGKKTGRPTSLTPSTVAKYEAYLRSGVSKDDAAYLSGIDPSTATRWHKAGAKLSSRKTPPKIGDKDYELYEFYTRTEVALRERKVLLVMRVQRGAANDHKFALKVLERQYPEWRPTVGVIDETPKKTESPRESLMRTFERMADRAERSAALLAEFEKVTRSDDEDDDEG